MHKGRTIALKSSSDIAAWIQERRKNFPTSARAQATVQIQAERKAKFQGLKTHRKNMRARGKNLNQRTDHRREANQHAQFEFPNKIETHARENQEHIQASKTPNTSMNVSAPTWDLSRTWFQLT